jgi:hypothetical protein
MSGMQPAGQLKQVKVAALSNQTHGAQYKLWAAEMMIWYQ